jgi:hypothetical protein
MTQYLLAVHSVEGEAATDEMRQIYEDVEVYG